MFKLDVSNATARCIVVINMKILDDLLLKMNELDINDFFIDKLHEDELFDNKLFFIELDHDAIENRVNEKISSIRELNILNRLSVR